MAEHEIASGRINIDLNDGEAIAGLRRVDAEFDRLMREIERSSATAHVDADISELDHQLKLAKAKVKELEGQEATVKGDANTKALKTKLEEARRLVKELDGKRATVYLKTAGTKRAIKDIEEVEAAQAKLERAAEKAVKNQETREKRRRSFLQSMGKAEAAAYRERQRRIQEMGRLEAAAYREEARREEIRRRDIQARGKLEAAAYREHDKRIQEMGNAERKAYIEDAKRTAQREKEIAQVPKLTRQYAGLINKIEELERAQRRAQRRGDKRGVFILDLDRQAALNQLEKLRRDLEHRLDGKPINIPLRYQRIRNFGDQLNRDITSAFRDNDRNVVARAAMAGRNVGTGFLSGFRDTLTRDRSIRRGATSVVQRSFGALSGLGAKSLDIVGKLGDATVRLGPFTTTIKGAIIAMATLGPIVMDVVGALGALVAVSGSALVGTIGAASAGALGFGLVLGSTIPVVRSLASDFTNLNTLYDAYHKQVLKTGYNSGKAQKKLQEYEHALKKVGPGAREAHRGIKDVKEQFAELSNQSKPAFLKALNEGLKTSKTLMKDLGPEVTQSANLVGAGIAKMFKGLRSGEAKRDFKSLFDIGQASLPSFANGIANLTRSFVNMSIAFGRVLPGLGKGFESWTDGILKVSEDGDRMARFVDKTTNSMRNMGHFLQSFGSLMKAVFSGGTEAGNSMLVTMTKAMDRWSAFLRTTEGRGKLNDFFDKSVNGVEALYSALAPLIASFVAWSTAIAPITQGFLIMFSAITDVVRAVTGLTATRGPLVALGATLATIWALGKTRAATQAVLAFGAALRGTAATQAAVGARASAPLGAAFGSRNAQAAAAARVAEAEAAAARSTAAAAAANARLTGSAAAAARAQTVQASAAARAGTARVGATAMGAMTGGTVVRASGAASAAAAAEREAAAAARAAAATSTLGRAGRVASSGLSGLGAIVTGVASPVAGLAVAGLAAGGAIAYLAMKEKGYEKDAKKADAARRTTYAGLAALPGLTTDAAQSQLGLQQAELSAANAGKVLRDVNKQINHEQAKAKPNVATLNALYGQRKQAILDSRQAQISETQAQQQNIAVQKQLINTARQSLDSAIRARNSRRDDAEDRGGKQLNPGAAWKLVDMGLINSTSIKMRDAYDAISKKAKEAGVSVHDFINANKELKDDDKLQQYAKRQDQIANATKLARKAYNDLALAQANQARITQNQIPLNEKAAASIGKLTRLGGKSLTTKVTTKYDDPGKAAKVGRAAANALQSGAGKGAVVNVISNTKSAEAAVRRLNAMKLTPKKLDIIEKGGDAAVRVLSQIMGRKLTKKEQQIAQAGGEDVLDKLRSIAGKDLPTKTQQLRAEAKQADAERHRIENETIRALQQGITRALTNPGFIGPPVPPVTQNVVRKVTKFLGGADGGMFASGGGPSFAAGSWATNPNQRKQDRAASRASMGSPQKAVSQKITSPKYLVGEEATPEFVIATNPAYRQRNKKYLGLAARALGMEVTERNFAAGGSPALKTLENQFKKQIGFGRTPDTKKTVGKGKNKHTVTTKGSLTGTYQASDVTLPIPKAPKFHRITKDKNKIGKPGGVRRDWMGYIEALRDQKTDWEREADLRQGAVKEPSSLIVQDGTQKVTDPEDPKKTVEVPKYKIDDGAVSKYENQIQQVMNAVMKIAEIIQKLVQAIPQAVKAIDLEDRARGQKDAELASEITATKKTKLPELRKATTGRDKGQVTEKSRKARDEAIERRDNKLESLRRQREENAGVREELGGVRKDLVREQKDLGFDMREQQQRYTDLSETKSLISPSAVTSRDEANKAAVEGANFSTTGTLTGDPSSGNSASGGGLSIGEQSALAIAELGNALSSYGSNVGAMAATSFSAGSSGGPANAASLQFFGDSLTAGAAGMGTSARAATMYSAAGGSTSSDSSASQATSAAYAPRSGASGGSMGSGTDIEPNRPAGNNTTVNNTFLAPPPDPHTFVRGVQYELSNTL